MSLLMRMQFLVMAMACCALAGAATLEQEAAERDRQFAMQIRAELAATAAQNALPKLIGEKAFAAQAGDPAAQLELSTMLLTSATPVPLFAAHDRTRQDNAANLLYRAARSGNAAAMRKLGAAIRAGELGFVQHPAAADCWTRAANDRHALSRCIGMTGFVNAGIRPSCAETIADRHQAQTLAGGKAAAQACIANQTLGLLVPGGPPNAAQIARAERYEKMGIEWMVTGDVLDRHFEQFRQGFNDAMLIAMRARYGPTFNVGNP